MNPHAVTSLRVSQLRVLGRLDDAERAARTGLAAEPQDAALLVELSAVLLDAGRPADGLPAADAAVALAPEAERAHRLRALLLARLGRHVEATHAAYASVSLAPEEPYAALAYATVLQQAGRLDDAMSVARRAVELAPEEASAHLRLADIASDRDRPGDRDLARRAYAETLRLDPTNAAARHDLAVLDLHTRHTGQALRGLVEAGGMDPSIPVVLGNVAAVLWRLSWRMRILMLIGAFVVLATSSGSPDPSVPTGAARIAAALVFAAAAFLAWRSSRDLPPNTGTVVRAALRRDRPLAFTYVALVLCGGVYLAVVVSGVAQVALVAWVVLLLLALVAVVVGLFRRFRRRRA